MIPRSYSVRCLKVRLFVVDLDGTIDKPPYDCVFVDLIITRIYLWFIYFFIVAFDFTTNLLKILKEKKEKRVYCRNTNISLFFEGGENMEVTDVRLRRVSTDGRMRAIASITFDNEFVVHDVRVIEGNNGLFVAMPSKRTPDGEFRDIAHP